MSNTRGTIYLHSDKAPKITLRQQPDKTLVLGLATPGTDVALFVPSEQLWDLLAHLHDVARFGHTDNVAEDSNRRPPPSCVCNPPTSYQAGCQEHEVSGRGEEE